jgi:hypothetical protein
MTSVRVSRIPARATPSLIPARSTPSRVEPAVAATMTGMGAAVVVPIALPKALIPPRQEPVQSSIESKPLRLAEPEVLTPTRPESKSESTWESRPVAIVIDRHEAHADADAEETAWGLTPVASRPPMPNLEHGISWLQPPGDEAAATPQASMSDTAPQRKWFAAGRKYWILSGAATVALLATAFYWTSLPAEHHASPSKVPMQALGAPPLAAASNQAPARVEESAPAHPPADEARVEADPAAASAAKPVTPTKAPADTGATSGARSLRAAVAAKLAANKASAGSGAPGGAGALAYDESKVNQSLSLAVRKAEQCDLWGRATGTAQLFITFAPSGKVTRAHLVGEPIASAPVARCILHHARTSSVPAFNGTAITVSRKITLR